MTRNRQDITNSPTNPWCRSFWVVVLLAHSPALINIARCIASGRLDQLNGVGTLMLGASCGFFLFKILDVNCLRFKTDRRSVCTLVLAFAFMHVNTLRYVDEDITPQTPALILAQGLVAGSTISLRRWLRRIVTRIGSLHERFPLASVSSMRLCCSLIVPAPLSRPNPPPPPRAPPCPQR